MNDGRQSATSVDDDISELTPADIFGAGYWDDIVSERPVEVHRPGAMDGVAIGSVREVSAAEGLGPNSRVRSRSRAKPKGAPGVAAKLTYVKDGAISSKNIEAIDKERAEKAGSTPRAYAIAHAAKTYTCKASSVGCDFSTRGNSIGRHEQLCPLVMCMRLREGGYGARDDAFATLASWLASVDEMLGEPLPGNLALKIDQRFGSFESMVKLFDAHFTTPSSGEVQPSVDEAAEVLWQVVYRAKHGGLPKFSGHMAEQLIVWIRAGRIQSQDVKRIIEKAQKASLRRSRIKRKAK